MRTLWSTSHRVVPMRATPVSSVGAWQDADLAGEPGIQRALLYAMVIRIVLFVVPVVFDPHNGLARWDALYYIRLALHGYAPYVQGNDHTGLAFLPLYPLLIAGPLHLGAPPYLTGALISLACSLLALSGFARFALLECGPRVARRAVLLLAATPNALFLGLPYSEALYLALAIWGCVVLRAYHRWFAAAAMFALAALVHPQGAMLVLAYLAQWVASYHSRLRAGLIHLAPLLLFPLPYIALGLNFIQLGASPLIWVGVQRTVWHYTWAWPQDTLARHLHALATLGPTNNPSLIPGAWFNLVCLIVAIPLTLVALTRLSLFSGVYSLSILFIASCLSSGMPFYQHGTMVSTALPLLSTDRFLLTAFPLVLSAALVIRRPTVLLAVLAVALSIQVGGLALFAHGIWTG